MPSFTSEIRSLIDNHEFTSAPMPHPKTVYIIVDVFEASKLDREHLEIYHHIKYPLPPQYSLVLVDVVNQDLGDQIAKSVSDRVGAAVEYRSISELDGEEIGKHIISLCREKIAVMLIDPSDKAVTFQPGPGHDPHSASILAPFSGDAASMAYEVVKTIGLMRRNTPERAIIGAVQAMCELDSESIAYLINDMNREECFRQVFRAHRRPFGVAVSVSDCNSPISPAASSSGLPANDPMSSNTSSHVSRKRPRDDLPDNSSRSRSTSTASTRFQGYVKCDWPGCTHDTHYTTERGLREHLRMKHDVPEYNAKVKAIAAFGSSSQPLQHLEVPTPSFGPTQTTGRHIGGQTVERDQLRGMASWASSSSTIDSPASVLSMSPMLGGGLDEFPNPGLHAAVKDVRVNHPPSPGLETRTRNLLLDSSGQAQLSDVFDFDLYDDATSSSRQTHLPSAEPWNQHNLFHAESEGDTACSGGLPVSGTPDNHNMSTSFTFRSGGQDTHF